MKRKLFILLFIMFLPVISFAALNELKVKNYGSGGNDLFIDVEATSDGGFVIVGGARANGDFDNKGDEDAVIVKLDKDGNEVWKASYGGSSGDRFNAVIEKDGYIAVGVTKSPDLGFGELSHWSPIVVKYDTTGKLMWAKIYKNKFDAVYSEINATQNGFVIAGRKATANNVSCTNGIIATIDNSGENYKMELFGGNGAFFSRAIDVGDGYIAFGSTTGEGCEGKEIKVSGSHDFLITKFNRDLKKVWAKTYGGSGLDQLYDGIKVPSGYLITGYTESKDFDDVTNSNKAAVLMKIDDSGNKVWIKALGGNGKNTFDGIILDGAGVMVAGSAEDIAPLTKSKGETDGILLKYDLNGELLDTTSFGGTGRDEIFKVAKNGNLYVAVGMSESTDLVGITNKGNADAVYFTFGDGPKASQITVATTKNVKIKINEEIDKLKTGDEVTLDVTPAKGYKVKRVFYRIKGEEQEVDIKDNKFELPEKEIVIDAEVEKVGAKTEKQTKKKVSAWGIILLILLLVIFGVGGYFLWKMFVQNKEETEVKEVKVEDSDNNSDDDGFNYYI